MTETAFIELIKNGGLLLGLLVVLYLIFRHAVPWLRDWLTKLAETLQKLVEVVTNLNQTLISQHAATEARFAGLHDLIAGGQQDIKTQLAAQSAQLLDMQLRQAVIYGQLGLRWDEPAGGAPSAPTGSRREPRA